MRVLWPAILGAVSVVVAAAPLACSSSDCKPGTLAMHVILTAPINNDADRVSFTTTDPPGLDVNASVGRMAGPTTDVFADVSFPHGYPPNTLVTIKAQAFAGPVLIGEGEVTVHTGVTCGDGTIYVGPLITPPQFDGGA
jgi:hypothetical protein